MKRYVRWLCSALFLSAVLAVIWFLHLFVQVEDTMQYIAWDSSAQIEEDGTSQPFSIDGYTNHPDQFGTYQFIGHLPEGLPSGSLVFEPAGLDLSLSLDGTEIWNSQVNNADEGFFSMAQAVIPLAENTSGELTVTCTVLDDTATMFPPLLRFLPDTLEPTELTALANREAMPAGAAALSLLLVFSIFLLGILIKKPDWSLIPLLIATGGLAFYRLIQSQGYYFLPEPFYYFLNRREWGLVILLALALYLLLNRQRRFWHYLGIIALWSAAAFAICYLLSLAAGGSLAVTTTFLLSSLVHTGQYDGVVYWLTLWLALTCGMISAYSVARAFADQQVQAQGMLLKNKMITENYRTLEKLTEENAARHHEISHQLTALECLYRNGDYAGMEQLLDRMKANQKAESSVRFTPNRTVNTILQDAAARAKHKEIRFHASVHIPETLNIPEPDLCSYLMNMTDNALEAAEKIAAPEDRYISIRLKVAGLYLTICCENSYDGEIRRDKNGRLMTTKNNPALHGFGCRQMQEIAEKYQSIVRFETKENHVFLTQTALRIPDLS